MAKWKRLHELLIEMKKVSDYRYGPGPVFWNDKDVTGKYPNKSELAKSKKKK